MTVPARPTVGHPRTGACRSDIGLTAFSLAMTLVLVLLVGMLLVNHPALTGQGPPIASALWLIQSSGMILSFLLGLAAVVTGRGRSWGIGAMMISVLGNSYVWLLVASSVFRNG
jgi:hypothetical protein